MTRQGFWGLQRTAFTLVFFPDLLWFWRESLFAYSMYML